MANWRSPVASAEDRRFVWRCSMLSSCALGLAAIGWATTMGFALDRLTEPNTFTLWCGGAIMLVGAALGIAAICRLRVNPTDDLGDVTTATGGLLGAGERGIGVVRRHPVVSCTAIAALSLFPAMSHAETTLAGALPWGLLQAVAVILGFMVLGPLLDLRSADATSTHAITPG
jgi:hypothetical protein